RREVAHPQGGRRLHPAWRAGRAAAARGPVLVPPHGVAPRSRARGVGRARAEEARPEAGGGQPAGEEGGGARARAGEGGGAGQTRGGAGGAAKKSLGAAGHPAAEGGRAVMDAIKHLGPELGVAATCATLGVARATFYRQLQPAMHGPAPRRASPRGLSTEEKDAVLDVLHEERFADL